MTFLLVRLFVKNNEDVCNPRVRMAYGVLTSIVGIVCNVLLFAVKLIVGMMIGSVAVMADAFNNLSDAASSIISFVGVKLSNRPADAEHPFGHGRYEYIAALVVAFLVFMVGINCIESGIDKIIHPEGVSFSLPLIIILICSVGIKVWLGAFNRKLGKKINSSVMKATSMDAFGDCLITTVTVLGIICGELTGLRIDGYMAVIVSLFILYAGIGIIKETLEPLLGQAASREVYEKITQFVEGYEGVEGTHDLIVHNYGPTSTMASIHAEVSREVDIVVSHEIIDQIEFEAKKQLGIFLVIHMDPVEINNEKVNSLRQTINCLAGQLYEGASIHDFRMVDGDEKINLLFDLVVPYDCKQEAQRELSDQLIHKINELDERFRVIMNVEHSFTR